jgi:DNA repair protein RadD
MKLRDYQLDAIEAVYAHLRGRDDNPVVCLPTGSGKSPILAAIARDAVQVWNGRVLILAHVKELLEQSVEKLLAIAPDLPVGVYSAGLRRKELNYAVTVAGIQSIWRRAGELGPVDLVIVDEAHLIPAEDDGMYRSFLADARLVNPHLRVIGLTATPYRLKSGEICSPDNVLNTIAYEVGVKELIVQGWLSPLRTKSGSNRPDYDQLHVRAGEFVPGEVEDLMDDDSLVEAACDEIVAEASERRSILIFTSGVRHGRHVVDVLRDRHGLEGGFVCGETPSAERSAILKRFRSGDLRILANVNVLTTGFDAPNVDCVAILRPTLSPGLFYQMVGRGFRLHPGKADCLVLDFGGNVLRHGPVDDIRVRREDRGDGEAPAKQCPECKALVATGYATCPQCGFAFPERERQQHEASATSEGILSGQVSRNEERVTEVAYCFHTKRDDPSGESPPTMRVEYRVGLGRGHREWVCFEHPRNGYARRKAEQWWQARSREPVPDTVEEAVDLAHAGALAPTLAITVEKRAGEKYDRIVGHSLGDRPPRLESEDGLPETVPHAFDDSEAPF